MRWASAYEMQLERESEFQARSRAFIADLKQNAPAQPIRLKSNPRLVQT